MKIKLKHAKFFNAQMIVGDSISIYVYYNKSFSDSSYEFYDSAEECMSDWIEMYDQRSEVDND